MDNALFDLRLHIKSSISTTGIKYGEKNTENHIKSFNRNHLALVEVPWCFPAANFNIFSYVNVRAIGNQPVVCVHRRDFFQVHKPICYNECIEINVEFILLIKFWVFNKTSHCCPNTIENKSRRMFNRKLGQRPSLGRGNYFFYLLSWLLIYFNVLRLCARNTKIKFFLHLWVRLMAKLAILRFMIFCCLIHSKRSTKGQLTVNEMEFFVLCVKPLRALVLICGKRSRWI